MNKHCHISQGGGVGCFPIQECTLKGTGIALIGVAQIEFSP